MAHLVAAVIALAHVGPALRPHSPTMRVQLCDGARTTAKPFQQAEVPAAQQPTLELVKCAEADIWWPRA